MVPQASGLDETPGVEGQPALVLAEVSPPAVGADRGHRRDQDLSAETLADAPARARRHVRDACRDWALADDASDVVVLLTSELVTNAVRHAPPPVDVRIELGARGVLVSCADSSVQPPQTQRPDLDDEGGRGIFLIEMLADAWGYETVEDGALAGTGKRVWLLVQDPPVRREPTAGPPR